MPLTRICWIVANSISQLSKLSHCLKLLRRLSANIALVMEVVNSHMADNSMEIAMEMDMAEEEEEEKSPKYHRQSRRRQKSSLVELIVNHQRRRLLNISRRKVSNSFN